MKLPEVRKIVIEQSQINDFSSIASEFMSTVLGVEAETLLLTDISDFSDFTLCGNLPEGVLDEKNMSLHQLYDAWDAWVIPRVNEHYGITLTTTKINMITLLEQVKQSKVVILQ